MTEKWHMIGIGGIGMSGLARILLQRGCSVSGSDVAQNYLTESLKQQGVQIHHGHAAENVPAGASVVFNTDIKQDNPELAAARALNCPLMHRSDLLHQLTEGFQTLAVTGTHGKTTTTALLAWVLSCAQMEPAFAVGGIVPVLGSNAGDGKTYFVVEADESDGTFLKYHSYGAIVTNIGLEHMNTFGTEASLLEHFKKFLDSVSSSEHLFWCGDDERLNRLSPEGWSYGFSSDCDLCLSNFQQMGWQLQFDLFFQGKRYDEIRLSMIGAHNALNASAVFGLALMLGVDEGIIRKAFASFTGVGRRCEKKGEVGGILFLDDYAHHPTEISATLKAIRSAIPTQRLIAVFQPHRYTRTQSCLGLYREIFDSVDQVVITDIYEASEAPIPGITPDRVLSEIEGKKGKYVARGDLSDYFAENLSPGDVFVSLGAGDITKVCAEVIEKMR